MKITDVIKSISPTEKWVIILIISGILFFVIATYFFGVLAANDNFIFLGNYHRATGDTYVYFSIIEEAKGGSLTFHNLFASEEHSPVLIRPFWLLVGWFAKIFNLESMHAYLIFRLLLIPPAIFTIYLTISTFIKKIAPRLLATALTITCSGVGFFYYIFFEPQIFKDVNFVDWYSLPTDLWVTEAYPILVFMASPHFLVSIILMLLAVVFFWLGFRNSYFRYLLYSGLALTALVFVHTYIAVYLIIILGLYGLATLIYEILKKSRPIQKTFAKTAVPILVSLPALAYQIFLFRTEPALSIWAEQSQTISPQPIFYLLGFGILIPLAIIGSISAIKKSDREMLFISIWCWATFALLYVPLPFNRRFAQGLTLPLGILSVIGIFFLYNHWLRKNFSKQIFIIILAIILAVTIIPTHVLNIWQYFDIHKKYKSTPYYLPGPEYEALKWLRHNSQKDDIVLSGHSDGFTIPAFTARPVYIGHDLQTTNFEEKKPEVENFFGNNDDWETKKDWLKKNSIDFIYYASEEKALGDFDPESKSCLKKDFSNEDVSIYSVNCY